jgi:hypothetical protein
VELCNDIVWSLSGQVRESRHKGLGHFDGSVEGGSDGFLCADEICVDLRGGGGGGCGGWGGRLGILYSGNGSKSCVGDRGVRLSLSSAEPGGLVQASSLRKGSC